MVFISFARNQHDQLRKFLARKEFLYPVVPLEEELIRKFEINGYPQNQLFGNDGRYFLTVKRPALAADLSLEELLKMR